MTYRLHHVHLICRDLEKMLGFFEETIGAELVERRKFGTADGATLDLQGIDINLRVAREGENIRENLTPSSYGYDHIGLQFFQPVHIDGEPGLPLLRESRIKEFFITKGDRSRRFNDCLFQRTREYYDRAGAATGVE